MLHLIVNTQFHFLCCEICQIAIISSEARTHIKQKHPQLEFNIDLFNNAIKELHITEGLPSISMQKQAPVKGLHIHDAIACDHCHKIFKSIKKMKEHHTQAHLGISAPDKWRKCKAQQLKSKGPGTHKTLWEVENIQSDIDQERNIAAMVQSIIKEIEPKFQVHPVPQDNRVISPWLLTTKWHNHISGHDITFLQNLVYISKDKDNRSKPQFKQGLEVYFKESLDLLETTSKLTLQTLNSPDSSK